MYKSGAGNSVECSDGFVVDCFDDYVEYTDNTGTLIIPASMRWPDIRIYEYGEWDGREVPSAERKEYLQKVRGALSWAGWSVAIAYPDRIELADGRLERQSLDNQEMLARLKARGCPTITVWPESREWMERIAKAPLEDERKNSVPHELHGFKRLWDQLLCLLRRH